MPVWSLWRCPDCGREFKNRNQAHSCVSYSLDYHFENKPPVIKDIFNALVSGIRRYGPVRIDVVKTAINLAASSHFAMAYPMKSGIKLEFRYDGALEDPRIVRSQVISEGNYIHWVKVCTAEEIDRQLLSWLKRAYEMHV